jgi:hypothetical protein
MATKPTQDEGEKPRVPSPYDRRRLSVVGLGIDERTILRAYLEPGRVRESTWMRLVAAAEQLGIEPPPRGAGAKPGDSET